MVAAVDITIAGWFVSAVLGKLLEGTIYLAKERKWRSAMRAELDRLEKARPLIEAVAHAAENGDIQVESPPLLQWLQRLKDAVEDADSLLDELELHKLQEQAAANTAANVAEALRRFRRHNFSCDPFRRRLTDVVRKFDEIAAGVDPFVQLIRSSAGVSGRRRSSTEYDRETGSLQTENDMFGRVKEKEEIVRWLTSSTGSNARSSSAVSLFSVVGIGGLGKTALAQLVYNDAEVVGRFELMMWVCVSNNAFDCTAVGKKILESATGARHDVETLDAVQKNLKAMVTNKRFLLVLDDVWNDQVLAGWEGLFAPLRSGMEGSKILLTTRMRSVAEMAAKALGKEMPECMNLEGLDDSDCLLLLNKHAFRGVNPDNHKLLQSIGEKIAKKLRGVPLAVKTVGGILNDDLRDEHWTRILEVGALNSEQGSDGIMPILRLSYEHLPTHLRRCFRHCSIFPEDFQFRKENLVPMWVAVGLIPDGTERPEDVGSRYFESLVRKSFFDPKDLHYVMHDLLHELAQIVSADECLRIAGDSPVEIPKSLRHLSIQANDLSVLRNVPPLTNLRTLFLHCDADNPKLDVAIDGMLSGLTNLRLLQLSAKYLHMFPGSARRLIHLRYLSIGQTCISGLPRFVCRLYHLQGLDLKSNSCFQVSQGVPVDICNLMNLRILSVPSIQSLPRIGKLTSLQALIWFSIEDKAGHRITELGKMTGLRELMITNLEKVKSAEEAAGANLSKKEQLSLLSLRWGTAPRDDESDEQLLDHLRPHSNLKHLEIHGYNGRRSLHWMRNEYTPRLAHIRISGCARLEILPPFGQLPYLKVLILDNLEAVKQLGPEFYGAHGVSSAFPSLGTLQLNRMTGLENWDGGVEDDQWFPCLNKLGVARCPRLSALPPIPICLRELELNFLEITTLPKVWVPNQTSRHHISSPPSSLSSVVIVECSKLKSLSQGLFGHPERLLCLENLSIQNCAELVHSPAEGFANVVKLKRFAIQGCKKLLLLPAIPGSFLPPSLQYLNLSSPGGLDASLRHLLHGLASLSSLKLSHCTNLTSFPSGDVLRTLRTLSSLSLQKCHELVSLDGLQFLPSLKTLEIKECHKLIPEAEAEVEASSPMLVEVPSLALDRLDVDDPSMLLVVPLRSLTSTRSVHIRGCSHISAVTESWLSQNRASLQSLVLDGGVSLQSLPDTLQSLSLLRYLALQNAGQLQSLPLLPRSLKTLNISGCCPELAENCKTESGSDWHKIAHISDITISPISSPSSSH
ncbi:putative disease resistance protein RGA3 [Ananas comosus]|uniref:Putative disease resistance protein RGA3 n=1 Tax=Ananas comosus TaxID=4615 RepID=A0A199VE31_ANACO|nr:putative disease resistance protein RGA3 [Ananas comosus]